MLKVREYKILKPLGLERRATMMTDITESADRDQQWIPGVNSCSGRLTRGYHTAITSAQDPRGRGVNPRQQRGCVHCDVQFAAAQLSHRAGSEIRRQCNYCGAGYGSRIGSSYR